MANKKYYKRPDGLYEAIRVINGKRVAFRGHSVREVEQKMISYKEKAETGRTFREVANEWETEHFPALQPTTQHGYRAALRRAVEHFGDTPIKEIKAPDVKKFIVEFARADPGKAAFGQKTVTNQLLVTSLIFSFAAGNGEIEYNPCSSVNVPRGLKKTRREAATSEDEEIIKRSADIWLLPFLILYTGLRKGEALALTYGDIDLDARQINVIKSVYHYSNKPFLKKPKTEAGVRTVPILDPLLPYLEKKGDNNCYLFSADGGKTPLSDSQYRHQMDRYISETGVSCTLHQLRHSYATMLFEFGIGVKDAQDLLGHATASMTQDIYTHVRDTKRLKTAALLNEKLRDAQNT